MKKKLALLLALTTVAASLIGCGSSNEASTTTTSSSNEVADDTTSNDAESNGNEWVVEGLTYPIPTYWTELETSTDFQNPELASKITEANSSSENVLSSHAIFDIIFENDDSISENDTESCYKGLLENLGNPKYAAAEVFYTGDDLKTDYENEYYTYNLIYVYQLDDENYLEVSFVQLASSDFPKLSVITLNDTDSESFSIDFFKEKISDSTLSQFLADEKGSF